MGDPSGGIGKMFSDPSLIQKLASNPKTSAYLADPSFMAKLQAIQQNPSNAQDLFSDPRMIQVLGVLMGVDMDVSTGPGAGAPGGSGSRFEPEEDVAMPDVLPAKKAEPAKKAPEPEPEPEDDEALEKKKAKEAADKEKALGTENYKKRNFDQAIKHYQAAWDLHKDITYLNNLGAAYFEKGEYQACIDTCTKAVEEGRELYADFKVIAKAYARIGTAYEKLGDLTQAIDYYNMSLREHRTPEVLNKVRAAERNKIEATRRAYIDPAKAEEAREEGNKKFKESDWPGAVAAYSEMIKRSPDDPRGYSNRAAAFIKLFEFPSALEDCDAAIKRDPKFIRAYIRKAQAYFGMREYSKSVDACSEAQNVDSEHHNGANAREIEQQQQKAFTAMYAARENETEEQTRERLMRDPEVRPRFHWANLLNTCTNQLVDYGHHARSCDAGDSPASTVGSGRVGRAHEKPECPHQDPEAHCRGCYSCWQVSDREIGNWGSACDGQECGKGWGRCWFGDRFPVTGVLGRVRQLLPGLQSWALSNPFYEPHEGRTVDCGLYCNRIALFNIEEQHNVFLSCQSLPPKTPRWYHCTKHGHDLYLPPRNRARFVEHPNRHQWPLTHCYLLLSSSIV